MEASYQGSHAYNNNALQNTNVVRGGGFNVTYESYPTCYRQSMPVAATNTNCGFRTVLYLI